jgi:hypothetical protein
MTIDDECDDIEGSKLVGLKDIMLILYRLFKSLFLEYSCQESRFSCSTWLQVG